MTTGKKLLALRGKRTRKQVFLESGVPERTLIHLERDERMGQFKTMIKLSEYYGVTLDELKPDGKDLDDILYKE